MKKIQWRELMKFKPNNCSLKKNIPNFDSWGILEKCLEKYEEDDLSNGKGLKYWCWFCQTWYKKTWIRLAIPIAYGYSVPWEHPSMLTSTFVVPALAHLCWDLGPGGTQPHQAHLYEALGMKSWEPVLLGTLQLWAESLLRETSVRRVTVWEAGYE